MAFPFSIPEKTAYRRFMDGMAFGKAAEIPGKPLFVLPTTDYASFDADGWITNHNRNIYTSVKLALDACTAGRGDAIVLGPGTHTVSTASLAMSKAGVKIWGPEAWMGVGTRIPSAILTTDVTADEIMNVTAPDCGLIGVTVRPITASDAIDLSAAADGFLVDGCHFDLYTPAVNAATVGITGAAANDVMIRRSTFISDGAQGNAIVATGLLNSYIEECVLYNTAGTWASAILCGAATSGLFIHGNRFASYGTALSVGVNGTGATIAGGVQLTDNRFSVLVTAPVDNFDSGEAELGVNYIMTVGGGTGGTLVTATT